MKKLLGLLLISLLTIGVVTGCGSSNNDSSKQSTAHGDTKNAPAASENAGAREYPIGDEVEKEGMKIAAVYLRPVVMEPTQKAGLKADQSDIHLEADIKALENNPLSFGAGEFVPYLTVNYKLVNKDNGQVQEGSFMPMNAGDGSHYGANVKMMGAANYSLTFSIESPEKQDFLIHTDKETGVHGTFWKKPIVVSWDFPFVPRKF